MDKNKHEEEYLKEPKEKEVQGEKEEKGIKEEVKEETKEEEKKEEKLEEDSKEKKEKEVESKKGNEGKKIKVKKVQFQFKTIVLLLFIVTIIISLSDFLGSNNKGKTETISYSKFIALIKDKKVKEVREKDGYIVTKADKKEYRARLISERVASDPNLVNALRTQGVDITAEPPKEASILLSIFISWFPMLLLVGIWFIMLNKKGGSGGSGVFGMGKSSAKENGEKESDVRFSDAAGIDEAKQELVEVVDFLKNPEKYKQIGAKIPRGVLLLGQPGTGKTLLAKAVAGEAQVPFFSISGSEFVEMFLGVGASRVRDLFNKARKASPCIVFIDEIDAVGRKRGSGQGGGNDEREQTLNQLLVEMDGFSTEETIIVIAATNRAEILDNALLRPGRFDRQVVVDKPDIKGREEILNVHTKGKKLGDDVDLRTLAKKTPGFAGADLANLLNEAAILAARAGREEILMEDLEEASEKVTIGPARKSRVTMLKERKIVAYHEVGHAMLQYKHRKYQNPVHKVTIVPRGSAALGYTSSLPTEDRYLKSKKEYLADIRSLLGGRAAEEVVFGDITTGASNDIERATGIAHAMVTKLGMSEKFGPVLLDATKEGDLYRNKIYGEETAKDIDDEIHKLINVAYQETLTYLKENYGLLDFISKRLLEVETISGSELEELIEKYPENSEVESGE